ncbi:MAG: WD40 repeat domain-containing protein [Armatimonadota bacterium]
MRFDKTWVSLNHLLMILVIVSSIISIPVLADDSIALQWKQPVKPLVSLAISNTGRYYGAVDVNGNVRYYGTNGKIIWQKKIKGATSMLIARNGESVLVYALRDAKNLTISFFNINGMLLWKHKVQGSVSAGAVSPDGDYAAVTTAKGYVYLYKPDPRRPKYRRWRMDGIGHSIDFSPDTSRLIVGTWQKSMLVSYDIDGKFLWRSMHTTDRQYDVQVSADGRAILCVLPGINKDSAMEIGLWDSGGQCLWRQNLLGFNPKALVSPESLYVAISYAKFLSPGKSEIAERKVAVFRPDGSLSWEKGGLFFGPRLVALAPKGSSVIVTDGVKSLFRINGKGKILTKMTLGGTVRQIITADDGSRILLYCGDGWLYLFDIR